MSTVATIDFTGGGIRDNDIATGASIAASKLKHQYTIDVELAEQNTTVADKQVLAHIVRGATATLVAFQGCIVTKGAGATDTISIDLQKGNASDAFATVCTTPVEILGTGANRTVVAATLATTALVAGDILKVVLDETTVGTQAKGCIATITLIEDPA